MDLACPLDSRNLNQVFFNLTQTFERFCNRIPCIRGGETYAAGFPHLYYYSNPEFAAAFLQRCQAYQQQTPEAFLPRAGVFGDVLLPLLNSCLSLFAVSVR